MTGKVIPHYFMQFFSNKELLAVFVTALGLSFLLSSCSDSQEQEAFLGPVTIPDDFVEMTAGGAVDNKTYNECLFKERGIRNAIMTGRHTGICVIGRPFGCRALVMTGYNAVLCRDLTNHFPRGAFPRAPHFSVNRQKAFMT